MIPFSTSFMMSMERRATLVTRCTERFSRSSNNKHIQFARLYKRGMVGSTSDVVWWMQILTPFIFFNRRIEYEMSKMQTND